MDDSLIVYNNAIRVFEFYENNKSYIKTRSQELISAKDKKDAYQSLDDAKRMFFIIRKELVKLSDNEKKFSAGKPSPKYKDITYAEYFQEIDEYRFFQRETENQIVNMNAPAPMYDSRIAPILINEYKNIDTSDVYCADLVNLPLYIPVVVKPYALLTSTELALRNQILKIVPTITKLEPPKKVNIVRHSIKRDTVVVENNNYTDGIPIYAYNKYGSGALIGFLSNRKFVKIKTSDYEQYAVPLFARELLNNDKELDNMLKIRFGGYYLGLY
jgi:hypothetical protein